MKRSLLLCCTLLSLLSACVPRPPEIPYAAVPGNMLARSLEEHRRRFTSLKALARIEMERKGKRRVYESAAIVQRGFERLRVEGYGPLGQTLFTLVWSGGEVRLLPADGSGVRTIGREGIAAVVGVGLAPEDLCAVLAGAAPRLSDSADIAAGCSTDGRCAIDLPEGDERWRVHLLRTPGAEEGDAKIEAIERYRSGTLAFLVRYEGRASAGNYALPKRVTVHDPGQGVTLAIEYLDAEVNVPLEERVFSLTGGGEGTW